MAHPRRRRAEMLLHQRDQREHAAFAGVVGAHDDADVLDRDDDAAGSRRSATARLTPWPRRRHVLRGRRAKLLERIQGAGADVAEDHADRADHRGSQSLLSLHRKARIVRMTDRTFAPFRLTSRVCPGICTKLHPSPSWPSLRACFVVGIGGQPYTAADAVRGRNRRPQAESLDRRPQRAVQSALRHRRRVAAHAHALRRAHRVRRLRAPAARAAAGGRRLSIARAVRHPRPDRRMAP